jgi:hypothetical protein
MSNPEAVKSQFKPYPGGVLVHDPFTNSYLAGDLRTINNQREDDEAGTSQKDH